MKRKIVVWGTLKDEEKILIGLELLADKNRVDLIVYKEPDADEVLYQELMSGWRDNDNFELPAGYERMERELSASVSLLPEDIRVEKADIITRAQTEWHFIVLSSKLNEAYESELSDMEKKVDELVDYDQHVWDTLKEFWDKVRDHGRDKTLLRQHSDDLKVKINTLFGKLKDMRAIIDAEFKVAAKGNYERFSSMLGDVEAKISKGAAFSLVFDELKGLQKQFKDAKLTRDLRTKVWERMDAAFKIVKEKRFGNTTPQERLERRLGGLTNAIKKMDQSISRDEQELNFQQKKIDSSNVGQLETQIREAKIKMVNERIRSKKEKLNEMNKTMEELNRLKKQYELKAQKDQEVAEARKKADKEKEKSAKVKKAPEAPAIAILVEEEANHKTSDDKDAKNETAETEVKKEEKTPVAEVKEEAPVAEVKEEIVEAKEEPVAEVKEEKKPAKKKAAPKKAKKKVEESSEEEE